MGSPTTKEQQHQGMNLMPPVTRSSNPTRNSLVGGNRREEPFLITPQQISKDSHDATTCSFPPFEQIEFPISLVRLALAQECNISQRHSAAVLLKSYVDTQWSEKSSRFTGPEPPSEVLQQLLRLQRKLMATTGDLV